MRFCDALSLTLVVLLAHVAACDCHSTDLSPPTCGTYCGETYSVQEIEDRCLVAFGAGFTVVRQCAEEDAPGGCESLSDFSPGLSSPCADGSDEPLYCCKE